LFPVKNLWGLPNFKGLAQKFSGHIGELFPIPLPSHFLIVFNFTLFSFGIAHLGNALEQKDKKTSVCEKSGFLRIRQAPGSE